MSEGRRWTDERIDDLEERLDRVQKTIEELRRDVREDLRDQRREATRQHDEQTAELRDVRDELLTELVKTDQRLITFRDSFDQMVKHIFERDSTRQLETRKMLFSFAGPILGALIAGAVTLVVVIFFGPAPHP